MNTIEAHILYKVRKTVKNIINYLSWLCHTKQSVHLIVNDVHTAELVSPSPVQLNYYQCVPPTSLVINSLNTLGVLHGLLSQVILSLNVHSPQTKQWYPTLYTPFSLILVAHLSTNNFDLFPTVAFSKGFYCPHVFYRC